MTPVILLSDGYIANGSEPWRIPDIKDLPPIPVEHPGPRETDDVPFRPYERNERLARPWALPGTKGLTHRIGGLEKQDGTGNVSYDPKNHQHMTNIRRKKLPTSRTTCPSRKCTGNLREICWWSVGEAPTAPV